MKTKVILAALTVAAINTASAFIVTIESAFDKAVTTTNNLPIPSGGGFVATGFFTTLVDGELPMSAPAVISAAFQQYGNSGTFGFGGFGGVYQVESAPGRIAPASPYVNQFIYSILGNGSTIANSSEFVIYKHTGQFLVDNADAQDKTYNATLGAGGTYIMGAPTVDTVNIGGIDFPQVKMAMAVPEPSAAFLGVIGALGLLRRRRA